MAESNINLSFSCPKKWNAMTPKGEGRFCKACQKTVTDFSGVAISALPDKIAEANECGRFHAYQLHKPFNNWKDKIISGYQNVVLQTEANRLTRKVVLLLLSMVLVITGCSRHLTGRMAKPKVHRASATELARYKN